MFFLLMLLSKILSKADRLHTSVSVQTVTSSEVKQVALVQSKGDWLVQGPGGIKLHLPFMLQIFYCKILNDPLKIHDIIIWGEVRK
jgi:hypothetical protein